MIKLPFIPLIVCLALFFVSCQEQQADTESTTTETVSQDIVTEEEVATSSSTKDTISVNTFNTWKNNWDRNASSWMANNSLKAFNLPLIDLENIIGETPDSSRFYLGLESDGNGGFTPKLMVVGVKAGKDMIDYANGHYVYDVSTACPPFCGGN